MTSNQENLPAAAQLALAACARGELAPNMALMRLILALPSSEVLDGAIGEARRAFADGTPGPLLALERLWLRRREVFDTVRAVAASWDHHMTAVSGAQAIEACASAFDASAAISPEAGVALYSLGDADLLDDITAEIVDWMRDRALARPGDMLLEIGCGAGRFVAALAASVSHVTGVDISARMIGLAAERCAGLNNVRLMKTTGHHLGFCPTASLDLIYAVDSVPYIVQSGSETVGRHFHEAARVLKPNGLFLILNYSYRGDRQRDIAEVCTLAEIAGLDLVREARGDFSLWDGATFLLRRRGV
jgi:SAM-dependent methyltransferase